MPAARTSAATDTLSDHELGSLTTFLAAVLNDPDTLATSGLSRAERAGVRRAYGKLLHAWGQRASGARS